MENKNPCVHWINALQIMDLCEKLVVSSIAVTHEPLHPERLYSLRVEKPPVLHIKGSVAVVQYNPEVIAIIGGTRTKKMESTQYMILAATQAK